MLIVQKYGGTSVANLARIRRVARRCLATQRQGHQVAVVVSAMAGETNRLLAREGRRIATNDAIAKVSVVGAGMRSHAGVALRMFELLSREGINIQMIGTSEIRISVVVDAKYAELAVRTLLDGFALDRPIEERQLELGRR